MAGDKIQQLNTAIRQATPELRWCQDEHPEAMVLVRAVRYCRKAEWHLGTPTPVAELDWPELEAEEGGCAMGAALELVAQVLDVPPMPSKAFPPVLVLVADSGPSDDFFAGLRALMAKPWGRRATRLAVRIGRDVDCGLLQQFMGQDACGPLEARGATDLSRYIRWIEEEVPSSPPSASRRSGTADGAGAQWAAK
ncbi:tellurium resistance protein [candidate division WOR-3 bacterium]|nr:tellurium resistance protein [candidate division WOR-3 bacterium]